MKRLCPRCKGIGLIETAIGGKYCYDCKGTGKIPDSAPVKGVGPAEKSRSAPAQEQKNGYLD